MIDEVVDVIIERQIAVVLTMAGIQRALLAGFPTDEHQLAAALASSETGTLRGDFEWARTMIDRGARMVIASDAGVRLTPFAGFADSVRCGIEGLDITAAKAIELATRACPLRSSASTVTSARSRSARWPISSPSTEWSPPTSRELPPVATSGKSGQSRVD